MTQTNEDEHSVEFAHNTVQLPSARTPNLFVSKQQQQAGQAIYTFTKSRSRKNLAYRCSKFNACCFFSCRHNSALNVCLCRPTMTLQQGQGHRNSTIMPSLNAMA